MQIMLLPGTANSYTLGYLKRGRNKKKSWATEKGGFGQTIPLLNSSTCVVSNPFFLCQAFYYRA